MEVILKEDVAKLGGRGEVVTVAEGYGRNYLLPKKLAVEATKANKAVIEQMKAVVGTQGRKGKGRRGASGKAVRGRKPPLYPQSRRARCAVRFGYLGRHCA